MNISIEIHSPSTEYEFPYTEYELPFRVNSSLEYGLPLFTSSSLSREDSCISTMSSTDISLDGLCSARGSTTSLKSSRRRDVRSSMEYDHEVPLYKIRCLKGLYQCGFHPVLGQRDAKVKWTAETYLDQERARSRHGLKALPSLRRAQTNQQIQNKPFDNFLKTCHRGKTLPEIPMKRVSQKVSKKIDSVSKEMRISVESPDEDIPLPTLSSARLEDSDRWLLRRPTMLHTDPLTEDAFLFKTFTKTIDLKPLNFQNTKEQYMFYSMHYPLLLQSNEGDDKVIIQRKRTPTPDPFHDPEVRRKVTRKNKLIYLETMLDELENDIDDMEFKTELKDDVFYPQKWPWNRTLKSGNKSNTSSSPSPCTSPLLNQVLS